MIEKVETEISVFQTSITYEHLNKLILLNKIYVNGTNFSKISNYLVVSGYLAI